MGTIDLRNKRCDRKKVEVGRALSALVNSKEGLWRRIASINRDPNFCLMDSYKERKLKELEVIEEEIGRSERTEELGELIRSIGS